MKRETFEASVFFALGVFCWSAFIELTLSFGGRATFSAVSLLFSVIGGITAIIALKYGTSWYGKPPNSEYIEITEELGQA